VGQEGEVGPNKIGGLAGEKKRMPAGKRKETGRLRIGPRVKRKKRKEGEWKGRPVVEKKRKEESGMGWKRGGKGDREGKLEGIFRTLSF
jgi:hypothetical protein